METGVQSGSARVIQADEPPNSHIQETLLQKSFVVWRREHYCCMNSSTEFFFWIHKPCPVSKSLISNLRLNQDISVKKCQRIVIACEQIQERYFF